MDVLSASNLADGIASRCSRLSQHSCFRRLQFSWATRPDSHEIDPNSPLAPLNLKFALDTAWRRERFISLSTAGVTSRHTKSFDLRTSLFLLDNLAITDANNFYKQTEILINYKLHVIALRRCENAVIF